MNENMSWTIWKDDPEHKTEIDPAPSLKEMVDLLTKVVTNLKIGKLHPNDERGAIADQETSALLSHDFLRLADAISFQCGLILGDRARMREGQRS